MRRSSLVAQLVKNLPAKQQTACSAGDLGSDPCVRKIPWRRKFHGLRSLAATVHGVTKSDTTEPAHLGMLHRKCVPVPLSLVLILPASTLCNATKYYPECINGHTKRFTLRQRSTWQIILCSILGVTYLVSCAMQLSTSLNFFKKKLGYA